MKAYQLDISEFQVEVTNPDGQTARLAYGVRPALVGILLNPQLGLAGLDVFNRYDLATRIKTSERETLLLTSEEYAWFTAAMPLVKGFGVDDYELIRRIQEAPLIEVEAPKPD